MQSGQRWAENRWTAVVMREPWQCAVCAVSYRGGRVAWVHKESSRPVRCRSCVIL